MYQLQLSFRIYFQRNKQAIHTTIINVNYDRTRQKSHNIVPWVYGAPLHMLLKNKLWCCHYIVNIYQDHHNRHPMAHPSGRYMWHH